MSALPWLVGLAALVPAVVVYVLAHRNLRRSRELLRETAALRSAASREIAVVTRALEGAKR